MHWTDLKHLGILGLLGIFWKPEFRFFFLFYLIPFFEIFSTSKKNPSVSNKKLGRYFQTMALSQFNPFLFPLLMKQAFGQIIILHRHLSGFPHRNNYMHQNRYILPFTGTWKVVKGGSTRANSHSWEIFTQRYAYDFVIVDEKDASHQSSGTQLEDYYCFGKEVISPADGEVVAVRNTIRDHTRVGDLSIDWRAKDFRGNFLIIRHAKNEYSCLAHFLYGTVALKKGDHVKQGQVLGRCGNSGHSTEPHIHFHLQDRASFWTAMGLPIRFDGFDVVMATETVVRSNDFIEQGEVVKNCSLSADSKKN